MTCEECGEEVEQDGSPGVLVHSRDLGDRAFDLDEDHTPYVDPTPMHQWEVTEGRDVSEPTGLYP